MLTIIIFRLKSAVFYGKIVDVTDIECAIKIVDRILLAINKDIVRIVYMETDRSLGGR